MKPILKLTSDGSTTLYVEDLNEHYHSIHGAVQESKHVFINAGLKERLIHNHRSITIIEVGFGTGLNCFLTLLETENTSVEIKYIAIEPHPLEEYLTSKLNYAQRKNERHKNLFSKLHFCKWETENYITNTFTLHKIQIPIQEFIIPISVDLIYFDAFGPNVQSEMWTENVFEKLFLALNSNGILVTYCAKGIVKRTLKKAGFTIESIAGPPGKREMIRARKLI